MAEAAAAGGWPINGARRQAWIDVQMQPSVVNDDCDAAADAACCCRCARCLEEVRCRIRELNMDTVT